MFNFIKKLFGKGSEEPLSGNLSDKEKATAKGEAYVKVLNTNIDMENPSDGYFELEWNELFVKKLLEAGYSGAEENEIVDAWFTNLCRNIAEEVYEEA